LQITKVHLNLIEEAPGPVTLGWEQAAAVTKPPRGASRDGPDDVQVGQERIGSGGLRPNRGRRLVGDAQHEQGVGHHERPRRVDARHVGVIEPPDLARAEPMRHDGLDKPHAVGGIGARQRHDVLHRGVRDQASIVDVLLDGVGQCAHQTHAARDPAHVAIEAPRQHLECQAVIVMQHAEEPALLQRAAGRLRVQQLPKDQRLGLRHLPPHGGDGVAVQLAETPDAFVTVHDDVRGAADHDDDRHLLPDVGE
jgi:hypothetical protein